WALLAGRGSPLGECPPAFGLLLDFAQRATPPGSAYLKRVARARLQEATGFESRWSVAGKAGPLADDSKRSGGGQGPRLSRGSAHPKGMRRRGASAAPTMAPWPCPS